MRQPRLAWGDATALLALVLTGLAISPLVPRWGCMALLAVAIFYALKWLTWRRSKIAAERRSTWLTIGYLFGYAGMDAGRFFDSDAQPLKPTRGQWLAAAGKTALGAALVWGGARMALAWSPWVAGWIGMIGLVLLLHFGSFTITGIGVADGRRRCPTEPGGRAIRAASLGDFWGRRWNLAFTQLAHDFLSPLARAAVGSAALLLSFAASGVVHDLVISLPAGGGYGLPTLYFLLQAPGLLLEHAALGRRLGLNRGLRGRLFGIGVVLLPAPILFHPPFVHHVVLPMLAAMGALPLGATT